MVHLRSTFCYALIVSSRALFIVVTAVVQDLLPLSICLDDISSFVSYNQKECEELVNNFGCEVGEMGKFK